MFSGIIQHKSPLIFKNGHRMAIQAPPGKVKLGDSLAIDGVCLTVAKKEARSKRKILTFDLSPETLKKTTLGQLKPGRLINVERPLSLSEVLGGHIVQGHV